MKNNVNMMIGHPMCIMTKGIMITKDIIMTSTMKIMSKMRMRMMKKNRMRLRPIMRVSLMWASRTTSTTTWNQEALRLHTKKS